MAGEVETGASERRVVGRIRRAHGLGGVLVVEVLDDAFTPLFAPGKRLLAGRSEDDPDVVELHVRRAEPFRLGMRVSFDEIGDRSTAEAWRGRVLLVPTDEVAGFDTGGRDDLLGLSVELPDGESVGTVEASYELPQGILIEVTRPGGSVLIPYRAEFVKAVDRERGRIVIDPPEGLLS